MTKTQALAQARDEIHMGCDAKSVHVYDPHCDGTRVIYTTDFYTARGKTTDLQFQRTLALLGVDEVDAHYLADRYDSGRLEARVNRALACRL